MPTRTASVAESAMNCTVLSGASFATPMAERMEIDASGPTPSCGMRPSTAYTSSGTTDAYSPTTGGRCAIWAYAIDCGTRTAAPVSPAAMSPGRSARR